MGRRGFTLIELSIVLTIIGLMIGGSFKVMKMMRERAKIAEAKEQVLAAKNAVIGYVLKWPDLPTVTEFDANLSTSKDPNHPMFYTADTSLWVTGNDVCEFTSTSLKVNNRGSTINDVAFVIAHEGANYNLQTDLNVSNQTVYIHTPFTKRDDNPTIMNNAGHEYDDVVEWVTLDQLKKEVGCIDKPFRFIIDKLPNGKVGVQYPSVLGTAKLEVENSLPGETVSMDCTPKPQYGIDFNATTNGLNFYGTPTTATIINFDCNATVSNSNQFAQKKFAITIDPNYNKETNATCTSDAECGGGFCVVGYGCQTGAFDVRCVDGADCKSGICYGGVCGGAIGSACSSSTQCLSGYCNGTSCDLMPSSDGNGTGGVGDTCQNVNDCQSGLHCSGSPKKCN